jgi:hypothetical protein
MVDQMSSRLSKSSTFCSERWKGMAWSNRKESEISFYEKPCRSKSTLN